MSSGAMHVEPAALPREVRAVEHVMVPMRDGARLAARLWIPHDADERPVPAVFEYIPYRKRDFTRQRDAVNHPWLAAQGYACVRVDLRGSGESDGVLTDQYLDQEQDDGVDAIAWIASQPWCDGNVAMMGISWGGFAALQVAARRPPALGAVVAVCATDDLYVDNMHYMGGCLLADNLSEATTMFAFNSLPPDPALVGAGWRELWLERLRGSGHWLDIWLRHPHRDAFWRRASVCEDYAAIRCPVLAVGGWADGYTNAVFRLLEHLDVPRKALVGPWGHKYPHQGVPGPPIGFLQEVRAWLDQWLKQEPSGAEADPMLRAWMQDSVPPTTSGAYRPGRWIAERSWPSPRIEMRRLALGYRHLLGVGEVSREPDYVARIQSPLSLGLFAGKWCSYAAAPDLPHDQRSEDGGALVYDSEPLDDDVEILGAPVAELEVAADRPVAQVVARVSDVRPDGKATRVTYGLLNLTHRDSHARPEPLVPGRFYRVRVPLNHIAQRFPRGHRIRLALSTSYWPLAWPPPEPVMLAVRQSRSALWLPVRPPDPEDERLRPLGTPEMAPPAPVRLLRPGRQNWLVHRDLALDASELEVIRDNGTLRLEEIDLEIDSATWEWYRSRADDFGSVTGETRTRRGLRRGGWQTRVETRSVLTSDSTHFHLRAELDAYEGDKRIHSQNWDRTIERDLV